ncbi:MAG: S-layer protein [Thermobacillus sp. ZCTH02-B1]|uniref:S-layer homology domain-containing protein n=1 Tax=Thermobacillus sp. ZCTH02-B1 TaxID=1858795 RepID=UPI000B555B3D|nr:S-layer homology domain-containing protein [Thermobacillus sp. ZCTH02-B1]OUM95416.1 MAG: S-layer protein [Thermobacillus sp. ZCTH02-B1]
MRSSAWRKIAISALAILMLFGGAASAFADGKGKGPAKGGKGEERRHEVKKQPDRVGPNEVVIRLQFKDEDELKWALIPIMRLASKGVFTGYEDGTFKPHRTVTRIEALTAAVRLMGLRDQAESEEEMRTQLQFKDADKLYKKYPWAVGYVAVAVENGLFSETEDKVHPDKPADRLWATILLVKALGLDKEAKAKHNTSLPFRDAKSIPAGSVGYVALAVEKGLITGYQDGTFRPNRPVTRAELAALLDRTDSHLPDNRDDRTVTGVVKTVTSGTIVVTRPDNTDVVLPIAANAFIFRNGAKADVSALRPGDQVFVLTAGGEAVFIEVTKSAPQSNAFTDAGVVNSVTLNGQGRLATISLTKQTDGGTLAVIYNVSQDVQIVGDASLLTVGRYVEVSGTNSTVTKIVIKS